MQLFERVAEPDDLEAVMVVESLTNERIRDEIDEMRLVPTEDRVTGPGASVIMAAFTHLNPEGSRFSDGSYGVFYTAHDLDTAIAETRYHRERFMRATQQGPMELDMRVYTLTLKSQLYDIRGLQKRLAAVYHPDDYSASQQVGKQLRRERSWGIAYHSVRRNGGECAGVFRPRALSGCKQAQHLCYVWDGGRISHIYKKRAYP